MDLNNDYWGIDDDEPSDEILDDNKTVTESIQNEEKLEQPSVIDSNDLQALLISDDLTDIEPKQQEDLVDQDFVIKNVILAFERMSFLNRLDTDYEPESINNLENNEETELDQQRQKYLYIEKNLDMIGMRLRNLEKILVQSFELNLMIILMFVVLMSMFFIKFFFTFKKNKVILLARRNHHESKDSLPFVKK